MTVNYRQIFIIAGMLLFLELLSFGIKQCGSSDLERSKEQKSLFPLMLNDTTKKLLIGNWKYETFFSGVQDGKELKYSIFLMEIHENGTYSWGHIIQITSFNNNFIQPYGCWSPDGKWSVENGNLITEYPKNGCSPESGKMAEKLIFYSENEFEIYDEKEKRFEKYVRITESKHIQ